MSAPRKFSLIMIVLVMTLGLAAAVTPSAFAAELVTSCKQWHIVKSGENLSKIAGAYNTDWATLASINNLANPNYIFAGQNLCVSGSITANPTPPPNELPNSTNSVRVFATGVKEDQTVNLQGKLLATNTTYTVYMSNFKASLAPTFYIGMVKTASDGSLKTTLNIPKRLFDVSIIKVTLISASGDQASNWFYNITSEGNVGGIGSPELSFSVITVVKNGTVKIQTSNMPANVKFSVYMDKAGTNAVSGIFIGTLSDTKGGTVTATFSIPEELWSETKIDLRLENVSLEIATARTFNHQ